MAKKEIKKLRTGALSRSLSLARLGLEAGASAAGHAIGGIFRGEASQKLSKQQHWLSQATRLAGELGNLKGSLMKAGQMLSVYGEHFLPPEVNERLRVLQSDSPPVEWKAMKKVLVRQLGEDKLKLLRIEEEPAGAASLGQVHKAEVKKTGDLLALKIQYPGVDRAIDGDLKALRKILSLTEWLPNIPATDNLFEEVRYMLKREVNYELELENLQFFREKLAPDSRYLLPMAYPEFSSKRVLAMSFEEGVKIDGPQVAALSQKRRDQLAVAVLDLHFRELFSWHRVQTDPHFGNFRVKLGKGESPDRLVLFDYGAVRDLPDSFMKPYTRLFQAIFRENRAAFEKAAEELGLEMESDPKELKDIFYKLCRLICEPFLTEKAYDWKNSGLPQRVSELGWDMVRRFPLRSPPRELVFLDRKLVGIFTLLTKLDPKIPVRETLLPYLK